MKSLYFLWFILISTNLIVLSISKKEKKINFENLLKKLQKYHNMRKIAVAGADNDETLKAVRKVKDLKIADSILIGDEKKIKELAEKEKIDISDFKIINNKFEDSISYEAVKLVHDNEADMCMKGSVETKSILQAILDPDIGLKGEGSLSVISVFELENLNKTIFLTDPAVVPHPMLGEKMNLITNSLSVASACGVINPKVAVVTISNKVNSKIRETIEASTLKGLSENGQLNGCIIDGPITIDRALIKSDKNKSKDMKINGDADILVFSDINTANIAYKIFTNVIKTKSGNILGGTKAPCIITSRSDSAEVKINSIILAALYSRYLF